MRNEKQDKCVWKKKKICSIKKNKKCPINCSLGPIPFNKRSINSKIKEEEKALLKLKGEGMYKNRLELQDRLAGIGLLGQTLKKYFK